MKLVNSKLGLCIEMQENNTDILVVEDKSTMVSVVSDLYNQCNGIEGDFVLSEDSIIKIEKNMEIIVNPFDINFNNRKIISALYNELSIIGNEYPIQKNELNRKIVDLIDNLILASNYTGIEYNIEFSWNDLFKLMGIKIDEKYDSILSKIIEYMKITSNLCGIKILTLVNIKAYLTEKELMDLYLNASYNKVQLLLIDSYEQEKLNGESIYIIDRDKCLITK